MQKPSTQKPILYTNIQLLKGTYRLQPPHNIPWIALGNELKLQQHNNTNTSSNHLTFSEEISHNAFSKTKQLFKKKENSSIIFDDLPEQDIDTISANPISPKKQAMKDNKFQFDSFGRKDCTQLDLLNLKDKNEEILSNDDLKTWNSQSLEIDFNKVQEDELQLPINKLQKLQNQEQTQEENSNRSLKQFCFNLNQLDIPMLLRTPVKKWKDCKKNTERIHTQGQMEKTQNKKQLQSVLKQFMNCIQNINPSDLNNSLLVQTKSLFSKFKETQNQSMGKRLFNKENQQVTIEESQSTLTAKTKKDLNTSREKTKRKENKLPLSCQKQSKFKLYDKNEGKSIKQIKNTSKVDSKLKFKEKRFKF